MDALSFYRIISSWLWCNTKFELLSSIRKIVFFSRTFLNNFTLIAPHHSLQMFLLTWSKNLLTKNSAKIIFFGIFRFRFVFFRKKVVFSSNNRIYLNLFWANFILIKYFEISSVQFFFHFFQYFFYHFLIPFWEWLSIFLRGESAFFRQSPEYVQFSLTSWVYINAYR